MRGLIRFSFMVVFLTSILSVGVFAQTGGIRGTVTDPSGAIVPDATITLKNKGTGATRTDTTNAAGEFQVSNLPPGEYEVKVSKGGFKVALTDITVQVGENVSADFSLQVGNQSETVVITAETPAINTTDYKIDGVVNRKQIDNLPLNGRNFLQLAMLEPGVTVEAVDNPGTSPNNFFRVSIAGASQALTRIAVDGATINDRVTGGTSQNFSQESVQEFQISTFNFDITTSVTGVGSVNVVSRSGTNDFHGSAFLYYRDNNISAFPALQRDPRRFTDPSRDDPFFARRQMGGSIGGPIIKDKAFFFFNYEYNNQDGLQPVANNHPIFSQFDVAPSNPLNFKQSNLKLDYKFNDKHSSFLRFSTDHNNNFNSSNGTFLPSNWVATTNLSTQGLLGVSSVFTPQLTNDLRYSYGYYSGRLSVPTTENCPDPISCIGLGGSRFSTTASSFVIGNNLNTPQNRVLRTYQLTDTLSWAKGNHRMRMGGEWEHFYGKGSWEYVKPAFITLWDPVNIVQFILGTGGFTASPFVPLYNALPDSLKLNATLNGPLRPGLLPTYADIQRLPLAGFAMGVGDGGQPQSFRQPQASRNDRYRGFFGDSWQVAPRFTLTYGVAYVYEDNVMNFDLDRPAYLSPLLGGDLSAPRRDRNNWDPSVGFAWNLPTKKTTVVRGGGGIFHDSNLFWTRLVERAYTGPSGNGRYIIPGTAIPNPFGTGVLQFASFPTDFSGARLVSILPGIEQSLLARLGNGKDLAIRGVEVVKASGDRGFGGIFDPNTQVPYSMNVSAGIQRELFSNLSVQADFVMRRSVKFGGLHDTYILDRNRFDRARISAVDPVTGRGDSRPNPIIPQCTGAQGLDPKAQCSNGGIFVSNSGANFRYTGLHLKVDKRFSNRYLFVASYALSKFTGHNGVISYANVNEADDYLSSDRTHKFTFSGVMELPTYNGGSRFLRGLFNTWSASLIWQTLSTPPLTTAIGSVDLDGDGLNTLLLPGAGYRSFGRDLSKSKLIELVNQYNKTFPTSVTGKRTVRDQVIPSIVLPASFSNGDTFMSHDIRLARTFKIRERAELQFIGEVFNLFNISNLAGYGGTLNSPNYGTPTVRAGGVFGSGGPRSFQFAGRFTF